VEELVLTDADLAAKVIEYTKDVLGPDNAYRLIQASRHLAEPWAMDGLIAAIKGLA
jgi:hypothetical protein